jgi:hypothetical protein
MSKYNCPICQAKMVSGPDITKLTGGVYVWCPNKECPAQEVFGHGKDEKQAWEVVQQKFVKRESRE